MRGNCFANKKITEDVAKYGRDSFRLIIFVENVPLCYGGEAERAWYDACAFWNEMYNAHRPNGNSVGAGKFKERDYEVPNNDSIENYLPRTFFDGGYRILRKFFATA